ncbi:MAG TPA: O-antigen polymerase [Sedimentisphaerales bacterium]|nr:O-antigen polymerase [Sedimentisphaerales bacterium]
MNTNLYDNGRLLTGGFRGLRWQEFCEESLHKISWLYISWLILVGFVAYVTYCVKRTDPVGSVQPSVLIYYLVIFVHLVFRLKRGGRAAVLGPDILFLLFYTMFHLGYVSLYGVGIVPYANPPFVFESAIPKSLFVVNLGLISFLLGFEILGAKGYTTNLKAPIIIPRPGWCTFGMGCMVTATTVHLVVIGYVGVAFFKQYGYKAIQDIEKYTGSFLLALFWQYALYLMVLGLVIYVVSSALRYGKLFKSKLAVVLVVLYIAFVILEGDRGPIVQLGAPILLARHYLIERVRIRYLVGITAAVLVLFTAMAIARTIVFEPTRMVEEYEYQRTVGRVSWTSPFKEAGYSFRTLNITVHEVPLSEPYWKGASWRDAVLHIIPFFRGFALRRGWARLGPSAWVTLTYYGLEAAGKGFTMAAEGYLNFGCLGVVIEMVFFGMFVRWLTVKFSKKPSAMWGIILVGCLGIVIMTVREHTGITFSFCAQVMAVAAILNLFVGNEPTPEYEAEGLSLLQEDNISLSPMHF